MLALRTGALSGWNRFVLVSSSEENASVFFNFVATVFLEELHKGVVFWCSQTFHHIPSDSHIALTELSVGRVTALIGCVLGLWF